MNYWDRQLSTKKNRKIIMSKSDKISTEIPPTFSADTSTQNVSPSILSPSSHLENKKDKTTLLDKKDFPSSIPSVSKQVQKQITNNKNVKKKIRQQQPSIATTPAPSSLAVPLSSLSDPSTHLPKVDSPLLQLDRLPSFFLLQFHPKSNRNLA